MIHIWDPATLDNAKGQVPKLRGQIKLDWLSRIGTD